MALSAAGLASAGGIVAFNLWRALQGVGAAAALAGGTSALAQVVHGPARTRAFTFSWVGTAFGVGLAFGPLLAGWLLGHGGWRAVALSVAMVAAVAGGVGARCLQASRDPGQARVD